MNFDRYYIRLKNKDNILMKQYARYGLIMAMLLIWSNEVFAGRVKVISSSSQSWSGGVAGMHGARYHFTIEFSGFKQSPQPDTIWIGADFIRLDTTYQPSGSSMKMKNSKSKNTYTFEINANITHNESMMLNIEGPKKEKVVKPKPPIVTKGVAILSYKDGKKQSYFIVNKINDILPAIQYP